MKEYGSFETPMQPVRSVSADGLTVQPVTSYAKDGSIIFMAESNGEFTAPANRSELPEAQAPRSQLDRGGENHSIPIQAMLDQWLQAHPGQDVDQARTLQILEELGIAPSFHEEAQERVAHERSIAEQTYGVNSEAMAKSKSKGGGGGGGRSGAKPSFSIENASEEELILMGIQETPEESGIKGADITEKSLKDRLNSADADKLKELLDVEGPIAGKTQEYRARWARRLVMQAGYTPEDAMVYHTREFNELREQAVIALEEGNVSKAKKIAEQLVTNLASEERKYWKTEREFSEKMKGKEGMRTVNDFDDVLEEIIQFDPTTYGDDGTAPVYQTEVIIDKDGNEKKVRTGKINQGNFKKWVQERMVTHSNFDPDSPIQFFQVVALENTNLYRTVSLGLMVNNHQQFFRRKEGKGIPEDEMYLEDLYQEIVDLGWIDAFFRNNDAVYRLNMMNDTKFADMFSGLFQSNTTGKESQRTGFNTIANTFMTDANFDPSVMPGEGDMQIGEAAASSMLFYYNFTDRQELKNLFGENLDVFFTADAMERAIELSMKANKRWPKEPKKPQEPVIPEPPTEPRSAATEKRWQKFDEQYKKYLEQMNKYRELDKLYPDQMKKYEEEIVKARERFIKEAELSDILDTFYDTEVVKDKDGKIVLNGDGTEKRKRTRIKDGKYEDFLLAMNVFNPPQKNRFQIAVARSLVRQVAGLESGILDKDDLTAEKLKAAGGTLDYGEMRAMWMAYQFGAAARQDVTVAAVNAMTKVTQFQRYLNKQADPSRAGGIGNVHEIGLLKSIAADPMIGVLTNSGETTYSLLRELHMTRRRPAHSEAEKNEKQEKVRDIMSRWSYADNAWRQYPGQNVGNSFKEFHDRTSGREIHLDSFSHYDRSGHVIYDIPKMISEVQEGLIKPTRYRWSTHKLPYWEIRRARTDIENKIPEYDYRVYAEEVYGKQVLESAQRMLRDEIAVDWKRRQVEDEKQKGHGEDEGHGSKLHWETDEELAKRRKKLREETWALRDKDNNILRDKDGKVLSLLDEKGRMKSFLDHGRFMFQMDPSDPEHKKPLLGPDGLPLLTREAETILRDKNFSRVATRAYLLDKFAVQLWSSSAPGRGHKYLDYATRERIIRALGKIPADVNIDEHDFRHSHATGFYFTKEDLRFLRELSGNEEMKNFIRAAGVDILVGTGEGLSKSFKHIFKTIFS